jgi:hypothetical protein
MTRLPRRSSILMSFERSPSCRRETGMPVQFATTRAMSSSVTSSRSSVCAARGSLFSVDEFGELLFEIGDEAVLNLASTTEVATALRLLLLGAEAFEFLLHFATDLTDSFSFIHCAFSAEELSLRSAISLSSFSRRALEAASFSFFKA